ncbi:MocR-like pyridoxine biosynthesis transcription factor PdxR [Cupriavidus pampae]|uniref:HTH-type transcriptional regulatory protein GabR n=1 Tax=Cupriavidus pampae TaxID=659251 RepID=A0ABN7XTX4_9BURK|nr:PLP-dependent aminotransferase family protein [Cupriavidus pampae]CAG9164442.1 HTH-type transcriptional regulatory protein GabR [Cupriavidus pampae]
MNVHLTIHGRQGLAGQIYRQLRAGVIDGRLAPGERLPSTRELATQLGVSRKTTLDVFERLIAEGYLRSRTGDGTFVADEMTRLAPRPPRTAMLHPSVALWESLPDVLPMTSRERPPEFDFIGGVTDKALFPFDQWRRCVSHALRVLARAPGGYRDPAGEQELRLAVSRYLAFSRAVVSNWQDVIMTQGAQQAIDLLARVALRPGDVVAVEDPGYPPARTSLLAAGANVVPVPVDDEGIIVDRLPPEARIVYVTPSHQFPLGMPMSLERRLALLAWAQQHGALIVEDDYDGEYRFEGRPVESLKSLDKAGVVAYVGTFSKTIFPELRVGYVIPPAPLGVAMRKAKQIGDWHSCTMTQTALAKFMLDGYFAKHLRRMHKEYALRRALLLHALQHDLSPWLRPLPSSAGIHLVAEIRADAMTGSGVEAMLVERAAAARVGVYGIAGMYVAGRPRPGLLLGYGGIGTDRLRAGLDRLKAALERRPS